MPVPAVRTKRNTFLIEVTPGQLRELQEALAGWDAGTEMAKQTGHKHLGHRTAQARRLISMVRRILDYSGLAPIPCT